MPYPNFHAARVHDPSEFRKDTFRNVELQNSKGIETIMGKLKSNKGKVKDIMVIQTYHFPKKEYTPQKAKKWLKDHNIEYISFEAAKHN